MSSTEDIPVLRLEQMGPLLYPLSLKILRPRNHPAAFTRTDSSCEGP